MFAKQILSVAAFTLAACGGVAPPAGADAFNVQRCVNMGNALDAPNEGEWGHTIDLANFARIRAAGFDTVRLPIRWSAHLGANNTIDPVFMARVDEVLRAALSADLNVVMNIHHFEQLMEAPEVYANTFFDIWDQLAPHYQTLPATVSFEVMNEPNGNMKGKIMRRMQKEAIAIIRQTNPTRTLILGGEDWSSIRTLETNFISPDPNVIYTFHYYDPFDFTHQNAPWTGPTGPKGVKNWGNVSERAALARDMDRAKRFSEKVGRKVFLGEFGAYQDAPEPARLEYLQAVRTEAAAAGLSWCAWNFTATFPLFNDDTKAWTPGHLNALGLSEN